ncbi:MAG: FtsW/RodA/SpoVE family cell cycle protein [Lachnospiraceae bacterium]|nr:FtsW/RodA/SpoVE family cell cycle protein [Lachnospiraceae bacterium]
MFENYHLKNFNFRIIIYVLVLSVIGVLLIYSATNQSTYYGNYYKRQIFGIAVGFVAMMVMALISYKFVLKCWPFVYAIDMVLLVLTAIMGSTHGGAKRWLVLPLIGNLQPSDFSKIAIIVCLAAFIAYFHEKLNKPVVLFGALCMVVPHIFMVFRQPDLSTTILMLAIVAVMLYVAKISYKYILGVLAILLPVVVYFAYFILSHTMDELVTMAGENYQLKRILSFIWPSLFQDSIYQQQNSVMAIGSGGLLGKGLNTTTFESVKNGNFISASHTDFIFTIAGEELGFAGCVLIILLLLLLVIECLHIAKNADSIEGRVICVGVATMYATQTFINIAVATWIMPNTGLPLPFISYGLSSIISMYISVGLVLNVGLQRKIREKESTIFDDL